MTPLHARDVSTTPTAEDLEHAPRNDDELVDALLELRAAILDLEHEHAEAIGQIPVADQPSACNLLHYLALRRHDLRGLQRALAERGLSSLGRAEGHVLATLDAVLANLDVDPDQLDRSGGAPSFTESNDLLARHAAAALGPLPASERMRMMVTLPSDAADDPELVAELVKGGMDLARINCAHDGPAAWTRMADNVRTAAATAGREVRIAFDLAGPKLRTGPLPQGPSVVRIKPQRGGYGEVLAPAIARFVASDSPLAAERPDPAIVPVDPDVLDDARVGDELTLRDARDRRRRFVVTAVDDDYVDAVCDRTTYFANGTIVIHRRSDRELGRGVVGSLPITDAFLRLARGDHLRVRRGTAPGHVAVAGPGGRVVEPTTIGCELDSVFDAVAVGHRLIIDDGSIEGVVVAVADEWFDVAVERPASAKLKAQKGINLPDTDFVSPALSDDDHAALDTAAALADLVSLSFVRTVDDLHDLRAALRERGRPDVAIGLKIEHAAAFGALPALLLDGLQGPPVAIMLARGDLAIEVGFERLAEVQEEVLWLCQSAHVPVIWATQVAESLAKEGLPTRAEVTDVAWASRAECVMMNKGPHIVEAMRFVEDIVERMREHQSKQTPLLRRLEVSATLDLPSR